MPQRVALVTGGNRGLGRETCRQLAQRGLRVLLTSRHAEGGEEAAAKLRAAGLEVDPHRLDLTRGAEIEALRRTVESDYGRLDVLVNNAGILIDPGWPVVERNRITALETELDTLRRTMETNVYGAFRMCQAFLPVMLEGGYGRVVNVTSSMGQLSAMGAGWPAYRISKAALNAVTRLFAAELGGENILINSVIPGWVETRMGGPEAPLSVEEGVETILWAATLPDGGPSGKLLRDKQVIDW